MDAKHLLGLIASKEGSKVRAEVEADKVLPFDDVTEVFSSLMLSSCPPPHTVSYLSPIGHSHPSPVPPVTPYSPVALWVTDTGVKKVFDRHHGDETEAQRGGAEKIIHNIYN